MSRPDFWMVWRWYVTPCACFYFWLRTNVKKCYLDESALPQCYDTFFQNVNLKVTLSQLCSKFLRNNYVGHDNNMLTKILNDTRQFPGLITIHANYLIKTWVNIMQKKSMKLPGKLSLSKKNTILHFNKHCIEIKDMSTVIIPFFCQTFKQT